MGWVSDHFELSRGEPAQNMSSMAGLRGFAVFLVFLVHYSTLIGGWMTPQSGFAFWVESIHTMGNTGVDLFFVLSGYLIYGSLIIRKKPFFDFMRKRIRRIYPAFCVVFAIYLGLSLYFSELSKIPADTSDAWVYIVQNFLLLPGLFPIDPLITVAWSLSYEMFYYLLIPAVIALFGLRQRSVRWRVAFFMALATAFGAYCATRGGPVRLVMFIAGILLHEALRAGHQVALRSDFAVLALIGGIMATLLPFAGAAGHALKTLILAASFFVVCFCCFRHPDQVLARAFSWTPLRWLGNMSYSYYLLHGLALSVGFRLLHRVIASTSHDGLFYAAMLIPMFVLTLVPTITLFLFVERPLSLAITQPQPELQRDLRKPA